MRVFPTNIPWAPLNSERRETGRRTRTRDVFRDVGKELRKFFHPWKVFTDSGIEPFKVCIFELQYTNH
jgi:hypothetical protein